MRSKREIDGELETGERLLWSGQPRQGLLLRSGDWFMIPFSLLWGGFAIFWELGVLGMVAMGGSPQPMSVVMALFGIPFVLVGLYMIVGRFFVDARARANTYYGVTDHRAIIVSGLLSRRVTSLPFRGMLQITINENSDRSGTITFGQPVPFAFMSQGMIWPGMESQMVPSFSLIENAKDVYRQIREAQNA
jgi:hypothetical protein